MLDFLSKKLTCEAMRFFVVSVVGLVIDIGIAWALIAVGDVTDLTAATVGFSIAIVANYYGHQFWTFQGGGRRATLRRFAPFAAIVVLTLTIRLLVLSVLGTLLPGGGLAAPLRLGLAASISFFVSYLMSKFLVFHDRDDFFTR